MIWKAAYQPLLIAAACCSEIKRRWSHWLANQNRVFWLVRKLDSVIMDDNVLLWRLACFKGELWRFLTWLLFSWGSPHVEESWKPNKNVFDRARDLHLLPALRNSYNANLWGQVLYPLLGLLNTLRKPFQDLCNTGGFLTRHHRARLSQIVGRNSINLVFFHVNNHCRLPRWHIQKALASR